MFREVFAQRCTLAFPDIRWTVRSIGKLHIYPLRSLDSDDIVAKSNGRTLTGLARGNRFSGFIAVSWMQSNSKSMNPWTVSVGG